MKRSEFLALSDKYLQGTLTSEEELRFLDACSSLEGQVTEWDEQLFGPQQTVKERLYRNIVNTASGESRKIIKKHDHTGMLLRIAAVFVGIAILAGIYRTELYNKLFPVKMLVVQTERTSMKKIILPDGTKVWLNRQGSISYPETFRDSIRKVFLSGEAYFEVTHTGQPFIIQTDRLSTRVLGTSFVVKSYPGDHQAKVMVITGKVAVKQAESGAGVVLLPGQEATAFDRSGELAIRNNVDSLMAMAWMNNKLSFRQNQLSEVIDDLERRYDINIQADEHLLQCLIYADVAPGDKPMFILEQLAVSLNGKVSQEGPASYKLTGKGCDN